LACIFKIKTVFMKGGIMVLKEDDAMNNGGLCQAGE